MQVKNLTNETTLITNGLVANTFFKRLKGLLGSKSLKLGEGLILEGVKSIHTLFMAFPIDVVYVNESFQVIKLEHNMVPYKLGGYVSQAAYVLEMPSGTIQNTNTELGHQLEFTISSV